MMAETRDKTPAIALTLFAAAAAAAWLLLREDLPHLLEPAAGYGADRMVLLYSQLPRLVVSLLCGAALALSGAILQRALRNPLASPTTLGLSAGASLALVLAGLVAPGLLVAGREMVALAGSAATAGVVFAIGARRNFDPVALVLGGLIVSLYCGALATLLILLNDRYLVSLFIWGSGSLAQQDWSTAVTLGPQLAVLCLGVALIARPLGLLELGEAGTRSLGLSPSAVRVLAVSIAVALAAAVASAVGVIGFIGLAAPTVARLAGARRVGPQLVWSALIGAAMLWLTDTSVQLLAADMGAFIPTGAVTALLGTPLLLLVLPRLKLSFAGGMAVLSARRWRGPTMPAVAVALGGLALLALAALFIGRTPAGAWQVNGLEDWDVLADWRLPRVGAALAAGAMLAAAGAILQRLTGNEMASPEVLGISAGAMIGMAAILFLITDPAYPVLMTGAAVGTALVLGALFILTRRSGFLPERLVLAGIALGAMLDAFIGALAATGDPRSLVLLRWMSGTTYGTGTASALVSLVLAGGLVGLTVALARWLDLLPLGASGARGLGLSVPRARGVLLVLAGLMTAAATIIVGPLSFVGLMAPQIARAAGFVRGGPQILVGAAAGGGLMLTADWLGRTLLYPYEMPAGIVSALVGTPLLLALMRRT
ncbi:Ferric hydroxamate ABC transporter, permease component FhuB [Caenispirillum salinarum AK4]|uniref:Ferric hydroxamate ABC transporter, permease component FhuB n=1 Tax=Caenispirillum salinarum AK4 TaxID=1238182 RepID=K9GUR0_9PROT|nr:Fe(3+)-hydroxamate ABC transporter permease FhuB [Caenispirillum salinarum]EKV28962.1 Ferric hydroxamate ABC transporter, permease component FhuB [Caenispirillum salinarum AK4]